MSQELISKFSDLEILLVSDKNYHYVSGGVGPYYIDLRRGPNEPKTFHTILGSYQKHINGNSPKLIVGVPTTGVVYATGLSLLLNQSLAVMEKLNPERIHYFTPEQIKKCVSSFIIPSNQKQKIAFLGLEDMGVMLATALGYIHKSPIAILRRTPKGHGTSKTIEANLDLINANTYYIINDTMYPMSEEDIRITLNSIPQVKNNPDKYHFEILNLTLEESYPENIKFSEVIEIEDLWTTGTSSITLYQNIKKSIGNNIPIQILVFLDREQNAKHKFKKLNINAKSVITISQMAEYLRKDNKISNDIYHKVMNYVKQFNDVSYVKKLREKNTSNVCVGIDITPGKFPDKPEDTILPHYPYNQNAKGIRQYVLDILDEISKVPQVKVIKPNLAYYNSLTDPELHQIIEELRLKASEKGIITILDAKIGDIMRTQAQYAEKYRQFDAITAHGYMGSDSIYPITDVMLGCYVLVFTSNSSRIDLETQPLLTPEIIDKIKTGIEWDDIVKESSKVYQKMVDKVIDWQFAGSVGAVVGGTPNKNGKLEELENIIETFAIKLNYLPPILIPGVGTQGGSATDIMTAIINVLKKTGWNNDKIRENLTQVLINSASAINYSPRPKDATLDLVNEIQSVKDKLLN